MITKIQQKGYNKYIAQLIIDKNNTKTLYILLPSITNKSKHNLNNVAFSKKNKMYFKMKQDFIFCIIIFSSNVVTYLIVYRIIY